MCFLFNFCLINFFIWNSGRGKDDDDNENYYDIIMRMMMPRIRSVDPNLLRSRFFYGSGPSSSAEDPGSINKYCFIIFRWLDPDLPTQKSSPDRAHQRAEASAPHARDNFFYIILLFVLFTFLRSLSLRVKKNPIFAPGSRSGSPPLPQE